MTKRSARLKLRCNHGTPRTQLLAHDGGGAENQTLVHCPKCRRRHYWRGIYWTFCCAYVGQARRKCCVLEAETIGWGASSRNGGMVLTGMKLGVNKLISMYGRERTQRMYAASLATIDCVAQIVREENIDCDFSRCGHLEVACKQKHFDDYARQAEVIAREFNH